jgi:Na+-driven multidrug efflux pump
LLLLSCAVAFRLPLTALPQRISVSQRCIAQHALINAQPRPAAANLSLRAAVDASITAADHAGTDDAKRQVHKADEHVTYGAILKFIIPTCSLFIAGPMMSLVDTAVVGQRNSLELAARGPATTLCDSLIYSCVFIAIATTNLLAGALADDDAKESQKVVAHALAIGLVAGAVMVAATVLFGAQMMASTAGGNISVIPAALKYRCNIIVSLSGALHSAAT